MKALWEIIEVVIANFRGNVDEVLLRQAKANGLIPRVGGEYVDK